MATLAALVLGSGLTILAGSAKASPADQPVVAAEPPPSPDGDAIERRRSAAAERRRQRRIGFNIIVGGALELGAGLLYVGTSGFISRDLKLTSAGCDAPDQPCRIGTPVVLLIPGSATALGVLGATRLAAAREANVWRSPMFWAGSAVSVAAYLAWGATGDLKTRNERLTWDTTFLAGAVLGTAMQVWGALIAPRRDAEPAPGARSLHAAPGCGATSGHAIVCGLALAGF
jgi:hypothetical protein